MSENSRKILTLPRKLGADIEAQWEEAVRYYRSRGTVIFLSNCRFWEPHGFVQQSLANNLVKNGVEVIWLDGAGWRPYQPTVLEPSPLLKVYQLFQLPGRRFPWLGALNIRFTVDLIKKLTRKNENQRPLLWVQSGFDENVISELPYVDVFSLFDDPYQHAPLGALCQKARVVVCQNSTSHRMMSEHLKEKAQLLFPPLDLSANVFEKGDPLPLPPGFPTRRMGYIGSFFSPGFDLNLFETLIRTYPDWGFLLVGRTDKEGLDFVKSLKKHANFAYFPWIPRKQLAAAWESIDVSLLLYRSLQTQDGAFAVKALESLHFGVPSVGTQVPKTEDIGKFFPRSPFVDVIKQNATQVSQMPFRKLEEAYHFLAYEMNPRLHLARVFQSLRGKKSSSPFSHVA